MSSGVFLVLSPLHQYPRCLIWASYLERYWDDLKPNNLPTFLCENVERQLDTIKAIKTALKGTVNDIGRAEDSLKETEASIRETTSETLFVIEQGDTSIHPFKMVPKIHNPM